MQRRTDDTRQQEGIGRKRKRMNSNQLVALIICIVIGVGMGIRTAYIHYVLKNCPTETVTAVITDVRWVHTRGRGIDFGRPEFRCEYDFDGEKRTDYFKFSKKDWGKFQVGDCVRLIVSKKARRVSEWDEERGVFRCDTVTPSRVGRETRPSPPGSQP